MELKNSGKGAINAEASMSPNMARIIEKFGGHVTRESVIRLFTREKNKIEKIAKIDTFIDVLAENAVAEILAKRHQAQEPDAPAPSLEKRKPGKAFMEKVSGFFSGMLPPPGFEEA
jgi:hypothetical protein